MLISGVNLELGKHLGRKFVFRKHTADRFGQDRGGILFKARRGVFAAQTSVTGRPGVTFLFPFLAGEADFVGVNNDDVTTGIHAGRVGRAIFAHQSHGNIDGETANDFVGRINDDPFMKVFWTSLPADLLDPFCFVWPSCSGFSIVFIIMNHSLNLVSTIVSRPQTLPHRDFVSPFLQTEFFGAIGLAALPLIPRERKEGRNSSLSSNRKKPYYTRFPGKVKGVGPVFPGEDRKFSFLVRKSRNFPHKKSRLGSGSF